MENTIGISEYNTPIDEGYYVKLECCMCKHEIVITGDTYEDVFKKVEEQGWKYLISDELAVKGQYCGCMYSQNQK